MGIERLPGHRRASRDRVPETAGTARPAVLSVALAWIGGALFALSLVWFLYSYFGHFGRPVAAGPILEPVLVDIGLFTGFALHHSVLARERFKRMMARWMSQPAERSLYTWMASLLFFAVCWFWQPIPGILYRLDGAFAWAGYAVQLSGVLLTLASARAVDMLDLAGVRPVLRARAGLPPVHVPLETGGPYRFVRHPLYLSWLLMVFGAPVMTATRFVFAGVSTLYLVIAVPLEERGLVGQFGADYERYRRRVRWRMLPFLY